MDDILEYEYSRFLQELHDGSIVFGRYVDEDEWEDDYSHNEINMAKELFIEKATDYLHKNYPGKYLITDGWCVFIMTPERAKETKLSKSIINDLIIK